MIVPMKKAVLFVSRNDEQAALEKLKSLGLLHIDAAPRPAASLDALRKEQEAAERALQALPERKKPPLIPPSAAPERLVESVLETRAALDEAAEEANGLSEELARLAPWGEVDPAAFAQLRERGLAAVLREFSRKDRAAAPEGVFVFPVSRDKGVIRALVVGRGGEEDLPGKPVRLPAASTADLRARLAQRRAEMKRLETELAGFADYRPFIEKKLEGERAAVEFESVRLTLRSDAEVVYLSGFLPASGVAAFKDAARAEGWGVMIDDPGLDDDVPTLVKNNRLVSIVRPVFEFLGTVPGYREKDISLFFLVFFSVFYGMIVGDAAYGCLFLGLSFLIRRIGPRTPAKSRFATLLLFASIATIGWGAMTGTWLGIPAGIILNTPPFSWLVVPALAATEGNDTTGLLMHLCLIIGSIHLTLAHVWAGLSKWPRLTFLADFGWIAMIWGGFFIIRYLVLKIDLFPAAPWMFGAGFLLVLLSSEQNGRLFKGMLLGLAKFPFTFLSSISAMADVISYVRLFAVGLAGVKVEEAFNSMAASMGFQFPNIIGAVLILLFGHSLNLALGIMSIIVHGVRLNMLEFSGHLGLEWSGREYKPFA